MLKARGLQSVCASCRLNLAITRARNARLPQSTLALRPAQAPLFTQQRPLSTTIVRRQQQDPDVAADLETAPLDPAVHKLNIEVNVRKARQQFRDFLPRDHLSVEEYALYERLYGPPIFVDTAEELLEPEQEQEEIIAEEQPDGSTVLLRRGEDGELEELDLDDIAEEADVAEEANSGRWRRMIKALYVMWRKSPKCGVPAAVPCKVTGKPCRHSVSDLSSALNAV